MPLLANSTSPLPSVSDPSHRAWARRSAVAMAASPFRLWVWAGLTLHRFAGEQRTDGEPAADVDEGDQPEEGEHRGQPRVVRDHPASGTGEGADSEREREVPAVGGAAASGAGAAGDELVGEGLAEEDQQAEHAGQHHPEQARAGPVDGLPD